MVCTLGDLKNTLRKKAEKDAIARRADLRVNGWTVFRQDFDPAFTYSELSLGEAFRAVEKFARCKVRFWRCPVRGLAIHVDRMSRANGIRTVGSAWHQLVFSQIDDVKGAKIDLVEDLLITGLLGFYGLPNKVYAEQVSLIYFVLTAPPSVDAAEWKRAKVMVHPPLRRSLEAYEADIRRNLVGTP